MQKCNECRNIFEVNNCIFRPENNLRKKHPDRMFAAETFGMMDHMCEMFGPKSSTYLSQDDKSSVHIGVIAAKRQSAMIMNMRCRVRLPDHDFSVGPRHLLCPSVIAHCQHDPNTGKIGYTGKTYVAVRSSKHNNSTAFTHHDDLKHFVSQNPDIFNTETGEVKPILVKGVDGGPDENPRFDKNITMGCKTFQVCNNCRKPCNGSSMLRKHNENAHNAICLFKSSLI